MRANANVLLKKAMLNYANGSTKSEHLENFKQNYVFIVDAEVDLVPSDFEDLTKLNDLIAQVLTS